MLPRHLIFNGLPSSTLRTGRVIFKYVVHLLERATASFGDAEVRPDEGEDAEHREEDVRAVACIFD